MQISTEKVQQWQAQGSAPAALGKPANPDHGTAHNELLSQGLDTVRPELAMFDCFNQIATEPGALWELDTARTETETFASTVQAKQFELHCAIYVWIADVISASLHAQSFQNAYSRLNLSSCPDLKRKSTQGWKQHQQ